MPKISNIRPKISEEISIVAHQLKNPISVLKGYLEVLLSEDLGKLNPKQKEYLSDVLENIRLMKEIVTDLLEVSKIEAGKYELKLEATDLEKITQDVIDNFSIWAQASNCKLIFKKPGNGFPSAKADPLKIRQVIENLISNAFKYNTGGEGEIEISLRKIGNKIVFSCKDNGIGLIKEDAKKVFTKFYRSDKAIEMDSTGSGLGLYINKAIVELSGGKIWFKLNKKRGVTFYFSLLIAK